MCEHRAVGAAFAEVGTREGAKEGWFVGAKLGPAEGTFEGPKEGLAEGLAVRILGDIKLEIRACSEEARRGS